VNARRKTLNILSQLRPRMRPLETVDTEIIQTEIRKCEIRLMGILGVIFFSLSKPNMYIVVICKWGGGACRSKQVIQHRDDTDQNIMKKTFS
jgi:hypothetical protein